MSKETIHPIGLQELAFSLNLTNLQIVGLNEIGCQIEDGEKSYLSVADSLSPQEDSYLRAWLEKAGLDVPERETRETA